MNTDNYSVYLRPFQAGDEIKINRWRNDKKIQSLTCGRFRFVSLEIEKKWVYDKMTHNNTEEYFAICLSDGSDEMIGYISLRDIDQFNKKANFAGIVIDPEYQNGTYMIDANLLLLKYAFDDLGLNRVTGACLVHHTASRIMMEMLGFSLEGRERESVFKDHQYRDVFRFAILYKDYKELMDNDGYSLSKICRRASQLRKNLKETDII